MCMRMYNTHTYTLLKINYYICSALTNQTCYNQYNIINILFQHNKERRNFHTDWQCFACCSTIDIMKH